MSYLIKNSLFRIHSGKILNFLSVWMKSMMIQMLKARDVPTLTELIIVTQTEEMVRTSLLKAKVVLLLLHFFKKIQIDDEINMNF